MDGKTGIAPASAAPPPDLGNSAAEGRPPDPPGLAAIRPFFCHPFFRGIISNT